MIVRHIERHEFEEADFIKHVAFGRKLTPPTNDADDPDHIYQSVVVCCDDDGSMTARARNIDYRCMLDGQEVSMTGLSGVSSLPQARNLGRVRSIVDFLFHEDRERGVVFSALFPFSHAYYRKFGYEIASEQQLVSIKTAALSAFAEMDFEARMHRIEDGFLDIRAVSNAFNARYNLGMLLDDRQFKKVLGGDALLHGDYRYILYQDGKPCAFLYYTDEEAQKACTANVHLLQFSCIKGLLCTLGFLYRLRARYDFIQLPLPKDISFARLLPEPKDADIRLLPYGMARILHVEEALKRMSHPGNGRYTFLVRDDMIAGNTGIYTVTYHGGEVIAKKTPAASPDLCVDIGTLTQLVLGYLSLEEAALKTGVTLHGDETELARIFVHKPTYLSYHF